MLSVKQGGIKYHFLSLWYDLTWDWTQVSRTIGEHSNSHQICLTEIYSFLETLNITEYNVNGQIALYFFHINQCMFIQSVTKTNTAYSYYILVLRLLDGFPVFQTLLGYLTLKSVF